MTRETVEDKAEYDAVIPEAKGSAIYIYLIKR